MPPSIKGRSFGQKPLPLVITLKRILERYPDGGQILKELIQNADDAEAKRVNFVFDPNTYGCTSLLDPKLAPFQGPSLWAYNDATFTDEDWSNIEMLNRSMKESDPLKVGRFGLGFNSVYHLTDIPMILSGDRFGILEPREEIFLEDGHRASGKQYLLTELAQVHDQFQPFLQIGRQLTGDSDFGDAGHFNGTLFRFPLRNVASELSTTVYSEEKVLELYDTFKEEAKEVVLFLNHVQHVSLSSDREQILQVASEFCNASDPRNKNYFMSHRIDHYDTTRDENNVKKLIICGKKSLTASWGLKISVQALGKAASQEEWKMTSLISGTNDMSEDLKELASVVCSLPQISLATWVSNTGELSGKAFCCLPLPAGSPAALTGLPVHVNASFGLSDNRRDMKWTGLDQKNDTGARWNEALIAQVLPLTYRTHLENLIENGMTRQNFYANLPNIEVVTPNWRPFLQTLFLQLFESSTIFWTEAKGGEWIQLSQAIFLDEDVNCCGSSDQCDAARTFLAKTGHKIVQVPNYLIKAILKYNERIPLSRANPGFLRQTLKSEKEFLQNQTREMKLLLLMYAMSDNDFKQMTGIKLIPMSNGIFGVFDCAGKYPVFLDSLEHPRILLPGLSHLFVDQEVPEQLWSQLTKAAQLNCHQLRILSPEQVALHLKAALPSEWFDSDRKTAVDWNPDDTDYPEEPSMKWIETLWPYLQQYFKASLTQFKGLPIIPIFADQSASLGFLTPEAKIIFKDWGSQSLPPTIASSLEEDFDAIILANPPDYLDHPQLTSFIFPPNPNAVFQLLIHVSNIVKVFLDLSNDRKDDWREYGSALSSLTALQLAFLKSLPIFKARMVTDRDEEFFTDLVNPRLKIEALNISSDPLPDGLPLSQAMLSYHSTPGTFVTLLNIQLLSLEELILSLLDQASFAKLTTKQTDSLTLWIISAQRFYNFSDKVQDILRSLNFVLCSKSQNIYNSPEKLFNPGVEKMQDLFLGESLFPQGAFADPKVVKILRELGLKEKPAYNDIIASATLVSTYLLDQTLSTHQAKLKADSVVFWLEKMVTENNLPGTSDPNILKIPFLEVLVNRPSRYPVDLAWAGSEYQVKLFESPTNCRPTEAAQLVSSAMSICTVRYFSPKLRIFLGFDQVPWVPLIQHLKNLTELNFKDMTLSEKKVVSKMVEKIYSEMEKREDGPFQWAVDCLSGSSWIWNGSGFSAPDEIVLSSEKLDLKPYLDTISQDFLTFNKVFLRANVSPGLSKELLINVLNQIKRVHDDEDTTVTKDKHDLKLSINILVWFADKDKTKGLFVPIQRPDKKLELQPLEECMYVDNWIGDDLEDFQDEVDNHFFVVHNDISKDLSERLGVQSATNKMLNAQEFGFEEFGQHEPLTQRIKNILDEYPDTTGIFKELLQNADDAGATEVSFVIDWRKNGNSTKGLLDPGMASCQGRALWAYNNATFTKEDFNNIQKLGGQTKKDLVEKIGRFGIGFNSVYHVTDVPSFVSGDQVAFLDPYTTHLTARIKNKERPGVKMNFVSNKFLKNYKEQFEPYQGMFGCNIQPDSKQAPTKLEGTLFRLPLRSRLDVSANQQDCQMSNKIYDHDKIQELVNSLKESSNTLLLFSQNVEKVKLFVIAESGSPSCMKEVISIEKDSLGSLHYMNAVGFNRIPGSIFQQQCNILKLTSSIVANDNAPKEDQYSSLIIQIKSKVDIGSGFSEHEQSWLVTSYVGKEEAMEMAKKKEGRENGLMPCGAVAAKLKKSGDGDSARFSPVEVSGEIFCFLPLALKSNLPVHVNGAFAVASNRKDLWRVNRSDPTNLRGSWNDALMKDPVSLAYVRMLQDMTSFFHSEEAESWLCGYRSLFPPEFKILRDETKALARSLFKMIEKEETQLFPVIRHHSNVEWYPLHKQDLVAYFGPPGAVVQSETPATSFAQARLSALTPSFSPKSAFATTVASSVTVPGTATVITNKPKARRETKYLAEILVDIHFDLVHSSFDNLVAIMKEAHLRVENVSPLNVAEFLRHKWEERKSLPKPIKDTVLENAVELLTILYYCLEDKKVILKGLPLLLTKDNYLRVFDGPVFSPVYSALVPKHQDWFLNDSLKLLDLKNHVKPFLLEDLIDSDGYETSNAEWIRLFWTFLGKQLETRKTDRDKLEPTTVIMKIPDWEVVPVLRTVEAQTEKKFFKIKDAKMASGICLLYFDVDLPTIFKKLGCWELDAQFNLGNGTPNLFVSSFQDQDGLTQVLSHTSVNFAKLEKSDHLRILSYFESSANKLSIESIKRIKALPLFETIDGNCITLTGQSGSVKILKAKLPKEGMDLWSNCHGVTFLKDQPKLTELYKKLGLEEIPELEVYNSYIIKVLPQMPDKALLTHLENLYWKLTYEKDQKRKLHYLRNTMIISLKSLSLIGPLGNRKCASEFYYHRVEFFLRMMPNQSLIPNEYRGDCLLDFCKLIGLQCEVTGPMLKQAAINLERKGRATDKDEKKARYLVEYLVNPSRKWDWRFLQDFSSIRFIPIFKVSKELNGLHEQQVESELICFKNSIPKSKQHLVWTSSNLLPSWADLASSPNKIAEALGFPNQLPLERVIEHCKILCTHLSEIKSDEKTGNENTEDKCQLLTKVMHDIYNFLQSHESEIGSRLKDVPCILVESGKKLVLPGQVTVNIADDILRPHLFKMPLELGQFHSLFCAIGATKLPTLKQFSCVLDNVHAGSKGQILNPEEKRLTLLAISQFFSVVRKSIRHESLEEIFEGIDNLYLLTREGKLKLSKSLMFNDRPTFSSRVDGFDCESIETLGIEIQLLETLPQQIKPKFLSETITEMIDHKVDGKCDPCDPLCNLKKHFDMFLSDPLFHQGIARLVKHYCAKLGKDFDKNIMSQKLLEIGSLAIECRPQLVTLLHNVCSQEAVPKSQKIKSQFVDEEGTIILLHENKIKYKVAEILTSSIMHILEGYLKPEAARIVQSILNLNDPVLIGEELNDEDISKGSTEHHKRVEKPGDLIEDSFFALLVQDPTHYFKEEELVGYLQDERQYILARIVCEIDSKSDCLLFNFGRKYKIDVGGNMPVTVGAPDLYKFVRPNLPKSQPKRNKPFATNGEPNFKLEPLDTDERGDATFQDEQDEGAGSANADVSSPLPETLAKAKEEICQMLKEAWKLPEDERKKVLRRLYLRWHPDKNPDHYDLCNEAFKYLRNQIVHLEKTGSVKENDEEAFSSRSGFGSGFEDIFRQWDFDARFHRGHRRYGGHFGSHSSSSSRGYQEQFHPNPSEAGRWMKQARADLDSALVKRDAYEWTCFLSQQAAEKSLKAIVLFLVGLKQDSHKLNELARLVKRHAGQKITQRQLDDLISLASDLSSIGDPKRTDNLYERSKCPGEFKAPKIPATAFTLDDANLAVKIAEKIFVIANLIIS